MPLETTDSEVHHPLYKQVLLSCYFHYVLSGLILQALVKDNSVLTLIYYLHDFVNPSNIPFWPYSFKLKSQPCLLCKVTGTPPLLL